MPPSPRTGPADHTSTAAPACCIFKDKVYVFWRADDDSGTLFYSTSPVPAFPTWQFQFTKGQPVNKYDSSPSSPACCVYNNTLYLVFAGFDKSIRYIASTDGVTFPLSTPINTVDTTLTAPACCASPSGTALCVFWKSGTSNQLYWSPNSDVASTRPQGQPINDSAATLTSPAVCTFTSVR